MPHETLGVHGEDLDQGRAPIDGWQGMIPTHVSPGTPGLRALLGLIVRPLAVLDALKFMPKVADIHYFPMNSGRVVIQGGKVLPNAFLPGGEKSICAFAGGAWKKGYFVTRVDFEDRRLYGRFSAQRMRAGLKEEDKPFWRVLVAWEWDPELTHVPYVHYDQRGKLIAGTGPEVGEQQAEVSRMLGQRLFAIKSRVLAVCPRDLVLDIAYHDYSAHLHPATTRAVRGRDANASEVVRLDDGSVRRTSVLRFQWRCTCDLCTVDARQDSRCRRSALLQGLCGKCVRNQNFTSCGCACSRGHSNKAQFEAFEWECDLCGERHKDHNGDKFESVPCPCERTRTSYVEGNPVDRIGSMCGACEHWYIGDSCCPGGGPYDGQYEAPPRRSKVWRSTLWRRNPAGDSGDPYDDTQLDDNGLDSGEDFDEFIGRHRRERATSDWQRYVNDCTRH